MYHPDTLDRRLASYESFLDDSQRGAIRARANELGDVRIAHVNSTATGGGVAEMLKSLVPLSADVGVETDWHVMAAPDEFFDVTKTIHNGLQGQSLAFTDEMRETYRRVTLENADDFEGEYDAIVLHDPQSLGMAPRLAERFPETPLLWRCHIDLTDAAETYLEFVRSFLDPIDRAIVSRSAYGEELPGVEQSVVHPAIDPLTEKNRPPEELTGAAAEAADRSSYPFDPDKPLLVQVSRFDPWKDPIGVVEAYRDVSAAIPDAQLALVGAMADDDPEAVEIYREVAEETADDPDVHLLTDLPDAGINAVQREADVVLQKSLREGFALTVSEALWKGTPVIGSNVGGIPLQIEHGENGYLVEPRDLDSTAEYAIRLLEDDDLRRRLGERGRETVRERFLVPRLLIDYLGIFAEVTGRDG